MGDQQILARLEGVWRAFDGEPVLRGFDLELLAGEVHALVGRNGAGKSTAIAILLGLRSAHAGRAEVLGIPSDELGPDQLDQLAYVSGGAKLYSSAKLSELVAFEAQTRSRFEPDLAVRILDALRLSVKQRFGRLSTGQRQQVALALAIAARPRLLVLDEPALGLDVQVRRDFLTALAEVVADGEAGALLSTHLLGEAERIADRCTILHEGVSRLYGERFRDLERFVRLVSIRRATGGPVGADVDRSLDGVLAQRGSGEVAEILLRGVPAEHLARLEAAGFVQMGPPVRPKLEDLFLMLTGDSEGSAFRLGDLEAETEVAA